MIITVIIIIVMERERERGREIDKHFTHTLAIELFYGMACIDDLYTSPLRM